MLPESTQCVNGRIDFAPGQGAGRPAVSPPRTESITTAQDQTRPKAVLALGGCYFRLKYPGLARGPPEHARRGVIVDFTPASRRRLLDLCQSIDRRDLPGPPLFITLTYPERYPTDFHEYKTHLDTWFKRLLRTWPEVSCIWRLEFQSRRAPHYHLFAFGRAFIHHEWVATSWYEVVGSGDCKHLLAGTETRAIRSWNGVLFYAAKYLAKAPDKAPRTVAGRYWGVHNRAALPVHLCTVALDEADFWAARRVVYKYYDTRHKVVRYKSLRRGVSVYLDARWGAAILGNLATP